MKFMILLKATESTEAGNLPTTELLEAMGKFNEEMVDAGILVAAEGIHPSSRGARVKLLAGNTAVTDGPFAETKELISGFWIVDVESKEAAVDWAGRVPADPQHEINLEIRKIFEASDFGDAFTPELQEAEERLRTRAAERD
jgi:hypothetical protein